MEQAQDQDNITVLDEASDENKTETKVAANDSQTPEDGIAELKARLEQEQKARAEAERRAHEYQHNAHRAQSEVQDSNLMLIKSAIDSVKQNNESLKTNYRDAMAAGDFDAAAQIQERMSINAAKMLQLQNGKDALEEKLKNPPAASPEPTDPVEKVASQLSPRSAAWIRAHPQCITDSRMYQKMVGAHNIAMADGYAVDSDAYFDAIETQLGFKKAAAAVEDHEEEVTLSAASAPVQKRTAAPVAPTTRTASGTGDTSCSFKCRNARNGVNDGHDARRIRQKHGSAS